MADNQLANIMEAALRNNPSMGIGGMLHFNTETLSLIQVLEGPEMNVRALYNKIAADSRHVGCEILHERWAPTRMYKTWGMSRTQPQIRSASIKAVHTHSPDPILYTFAVTDLTSTPHAYYSDD